MANTKFTTVDEYIAFFPDDVQEILETIRATIREAVPGGEDVISYNIPCYRYHGWILLYSAYTNHYTISSYPPFTLFEDFKEELKPYKVSKSAIQMPKNEPVPVKLIADMAKYKARENLETEALKKKAPARKK